MMLHLTAEPCLLVICGVMDWTHVLLSAVAMSLLSPSLAGLREAFACTQPHVFLVHYRERSLCTLLFCLWDLLGSFHALAEEFVEVRGGYLELGKSIFTF